MDTPPYPDECRYTVQVQLAGNSAYNRYEHPCETLDAANELRQVALAELPSCKVRVVERVTTYRLADLASMTEDAALVAKLARLMADGSRRGASDSGPDYGAAAHALLVAGLIDRDALRRN